MTDSKTVLAVVREVLDEGAAVVSYTEKEIEAAFSHLWHRFRALNEAAAAREATEFGVMMPPVHGSAPGAPERTLVPIDRLILSIEEGLRWGLQWTASESNGAPLWARLRDSVGGFLETLRRRGVLQGSTAEDAYFIRCDEMTLTETAVADGTLNVLVGIAPAQPGEFVTIRLCLRAKPGH